MKTITTSLGEICYTYSMYLRSKHWKLKRKEYLESKYYENCCSMCKKETKGIHIHHITYKRVGNELLSDLVALCADCHRIMHNLMAVPVNKSNKKTKKQIQLERMERYTMLIQKFMLGYTCGVPREFLKANKDKIRQEPKQPKKSKKDRKGFAEGYW